MAKLDYSTRKPNGLSTGLVLTSKDGLDFEVIEYLNSRNVKVRFLSTGYETGYIQAGNLVRGTVKDLLHPSVQGVGYLGVGMHL